MTEMCRCKRDIHSAPLSEKVASFYASHSFDADYDPDTDESPIVCPGSYTEGPLPAPKTASVRVVGEYIPWQGYSWSFSEGAKLTIKTWLPGDELKTWYDVLSEPIAVKAAKGLLPAWNYQPVSFGFDDLKTAWTTYDKSAAEKAYKAISKMAATVQNLTYEKSDVVIEFGPKNWPVEPKPIWTFWQPWHNSVPSIHSEAWQEPIQLPDLPVDYSKAAEKINQQQFPTFGKLLGVANAY